MEVKWSLVTSSADKILCPWNLGDGVVLKKMEGRVTAVGYQEITD